MELPLLERVGGGGARSRRASGGARGDALVQCVVGHGHAEGAAVLGSYLRGTVVLGNYGDAEGAEILGSFLPGRETYM